jgi:hypothetical protein
MIAVSLTFSEPSVPFRIRCKATLDQSRMMYLAGRPLWEARLANNWTRCRVQRQALVAIQAEL